MLAVVEKVLQDIKSGTATSPPVISLHNILSSTELPHFWIEDHAKYVAKYGRDKVMQYLKHNQMLQTIREAVNLEVNKSNMAFPLAINQIAVTLCGFSECGETSTRAALDLVRSFKEIDYNVPVNILITAGKERVSLLVRGSSNSHDDESECYSHAFVVIGEIPDDFGNENVGLSNFKKLADNYVLLDPSLSIIGRANQAQDLLKDIFCVYGIDRLAEGKKIFLPIQHAQGGTIIFENAKKISAIVKRKLNFPVLTAAPSATASVPVKIFAPRAETKPAATLPPEAEIKTVPTLPSGHIRFFDVSRSSQTLCEQTEGVAEFMEGYRSK